jgi:RND superfamily putative drug exporter
VSRQRGAKLTALLPQTIASMKASRDLSLASYNSQKALLDQMEASNNTALAIGASFDQAKNDDLFFLPPEAFDNPDFERGLKMFLAPDGKSARVFITHESDPATVDGIARGRLGAQGRAGSPEDVVAVEREGLSGRRGGNV